MAVIETTKGLMDEGELSKKEQIVEDNELRQVIWLDYFDHDELVRRDVTVVVKQMPELFGKVER